MDGNDLTCEGTIDIINECASQGKVDYQEKLEKLEAEKLKKEEEERLAFEGWSKFDQSINLVYFTPPTLI